MPNDSTAMIEPTALPQGVVTFLFTDVEGSTRLLEAHREAAGAVLARHHEILEAAVAKHHGVVFETVGDAVYGAFAKPLDAVLAAVEAQRRLAAERWGVCDELRARMAVHSGAVEVRGAHYYGAALFECARIQALAHGGQTLTSATTATMAAADPPPDVTLRRARPGPGHGIRSGYRAPSRLGPRPIAGATGGAHRGHGPGGVDG